MIEIARDVLLAEIGVDPKAPRMSHAPCDRRRGWTFERAKRALHRDTSVRAPKAKRADLLEKRLGVKDALRNRCHNAPPMVDSTQPKPIMEREIVIIVGIPRRG